MSASAASVVSAFEALAAETSGQAQLESRCRRLGQRCPKPPPRDARIKAIARQAFEAQPIAVREVAWAIEHSLPAHRRMD